MNIILIVFLIYLSLMFLIAWYFSRNETLEGYFINKKKTGLWLLTMASFATMIGAGSTVAIISESYRTGISYGITFPLAIVFGAVVLIILSKKIKLAADKYDAFTIVEYFEKKYDKKNKILSLILQIFIIISVLGTQAIALASLASVLIGINLKLAFLLAAGVTILYITIGGLKIDLYTDFIQSFIIIGLFAIAGIFAYVKVGGIGNLLTNLPEGHLNLFSFAGPAWFFAVVIFGGFLYLGSETWQRITSSKNEKIARKSYILTIPFFIIFSLILLFLGLSSRLLLGDLPNPDVAIFSLIQNLFPPWLVGIGFAALLAVIMSSVDSVVISGSTIIYRSVFKKNKFSGKKDLFYARLITAGFGVAGFSLAFFVENIVSMSLFAAYLTITTSFPLIFSLYSKKISSNAIFYSSLLSVISILITFPLIGPNSFAFPMVISLGILIFYDKIFKKNSRIKNEINPPIRKEKFVKI